MVTTRNTRLREEEGAEALQQKRPRYNEDSDSDEFEEELQVSHDEGDSEEEEETEDEEATGDTGRKLPTSTALSLHVEVGKPFILRSFAGFLGNKKCKELWDSLEGTQWHGDIDVCAAAFACGLSPTEFKGKKILTTPKDLAKVFASAKKKTQAKDLWNMVSNGMKRKKNVAFAALDSGGVTYKLLPKELTKKAVLKGALSEGLYRFSLLPEKHKKDVQLALCAREKKKATFAECLRTVTAKEKLWTEWACKDPMSVDYAGLWEGAPRSVLSNRELMIGTVGIHHVVMQYIHDSLAEDFDFVTSVLDLNILALGYLRPVTIKRFPHIMGLEWIAKYMAVGEGKDPSRLSRRVPKEFWSDRDFLLGWLSEGGDLHHGLPREYIDDTGIIFHHAEHYFKGEKTNTSWGYPEYLVSHQLRSDKDFIRQLLHVAPAQAVMGLVEDTNLYEDYELQLLACAMTPSFVQYRGWRNENLQQRFQGKMRDQLGEYERFFKGILCGITEGSGSPLVLLNQGLDANIKKTIASFLDFPTGEVLLWLFQASINRHVRGFNPLRDDE